MQCDGNPTDDAGLIRSGGDIKSGRSGPQLREPFSWRIMTG